MGVGEGSWRAAASRPWFCVTRPCRGAIHRAPLEPFSSFSARPAPISPTTSRHARPARLVARCWQSHAATSTFKPRVHFQTARRVRLTRAARARGQSFAMKHINGSFGDLP